MENGFILPIEKEIFIDQLKDIVDKAEDMLSEEVEGERPGALRDTPLQGSSPVGTGDEVRTNGVGEKFWILYAKSCGLKPKRNIEAGKNSIFRIVWLDCLSAVFQSLRGQKDGTPQPVYQQNGKVCLLNGNIGEPTRCNVLHRTSSVGKTKEFFMELLIMRCGSIYSTWTHSETRMWFTVYKVDCCVSPWMKNYNSSQNMHKWRRKYLQFIDTGFPAKLFPHQ